MPCEEANFKLRAHRVYPQSAAGVGMRQQAAACQSAIDVKIA